MKLIERIVDFTRWPTSRKATLIGTLGALATLVTWLTVHAVHLTSEPSSRPSIIDVGVLDGFLLNYTIVQALVILATIPAAHAGKDARWTAHLHVLVASAANVYAMYLFGTMSTPLVALYPAMVVLWVLFFDERIAATGLVGMFVWMIVAHRLEGAGAISFAPVLIERSVDAQNSGPWFYTVFNGIVVITGYSYLLCYLVLALRRLQEERLQKLHSELTETAKNLERSNGIIRRYVPTQVADQIMSGEVETVGRHERRKLTIFFSDLVGFTEISEILEPEDLSSLLHEYFSKMTDIAHQHGGTVDELSGDAILIFFGAPVATDDKDHAMRAIRMAQEMQQAMAGLNSKWRAAGVIDSLDVRIGINTGVVTVGNFGSTDRMKYAALGKHVNLAARVQAQCEPGRVLFSHSTWLLVRDSVPCTPRGEMHFKGISKPVLCYELSTD